MARVVQKQQPLISPWLLRIVIGSAIAVFAGGAGAWVHDQNTRQSEASTINAVQSKEIEVQNRDIEEMKGSLRRIENKLDDIRREK